ncbi:hypothetical protein QJS04_geneDACA005213 [Acorus gramineus]|uniref:Myb/SANT-like domain-containing protein n=1 Tax=Acorus gramineus TaxID=55184 RepID=A0AAV9AV79_ACOGR|nr:hypothetical protein QJS04_geneDACA005213 [Acorus gramineus]
MELSKVKAVWDSDKHATFVGICLKQVQACNKPCQTLNKLGYMNLEKEFYEQTGLRYHQSQFKNHWDITKRNWQTWKTLKKETGARFCNAKKTYTQTPEWWAASGKRFPGGEKFAHYPLEHEDELDVLFGLEAHINRVCNLIALRTELLTKRFARENVPTIASVLALLNDTHGIPQDCDEWFFAVSLLRNEVNRQMFVALKNPERRACWIKRKYELALGK